MHEVVCCDDRFGFGLYRKAVRFLGVWGVPESLFCVSFFFFFSSSLFFFLSCIFRRNLFPMSVFSVFFLGGAGLGFVIAGSFCFCFYSYSYLFGREGGRGAAGIAYMYSLVNKFMNERMNDRQLRSKGANSASRVAICVSVMGKQLHFSSLLTLHRVECCAVKSRAQGAYFQD